MDTITALIHAIRNFTGAILLVSHDRHLVKCAIEGAPLVSADGEDEESDDDEDEEESETKPGKVYMVGVKGNLKVLERGTDHYVEIIQKRMKREGLL
jgi:ATP-binding cassette, subfamily F, member 3